MTGEWQKKLRNEDPLAALAAMSGVNRRQSSNTDQMATVISLEKIRTDGGTQPRAKLDQAIIDSYAEDMLNGDLFPPVIVFYDGTHYWLADGFHRVYAARKAGIEALAVEVRQGRQREAILYSVGVNATHGLRRTNADKRRAVITLLTDPEWSTWANREIARQCRVAETTVRNIREELSAQNAQIDESALLDRGNQNSRPTEQEVRKVKRGGTEYTQRVSSGKRQRAAARHEPDMTGSPQEGVDPIVEARQQIVALLAHGPMSPVELRSEMGEMPSVVYEVARDGLFQDGTLVRDRDVQSGHVTYRLADQPVGDSAPDPSSAMAAGPSALPPHGEFVRLGVDAHSQDHDPDRESAYRLRLQLERAAMDATSALERLFQIRGIRTLHLLSSQEMAETDDLLRGLLEYVWDEDAGDNPTAYHIRELREKLAIMDETGQPYDAALDEEG